LFPLLLAFESPLPEARTGCREKIKLISDRAAGSAAVFHCKFHCANMIYKDSEDRESQRAADLES
jgi:hypothetical protein